MNINKKNLFLTLDFPPLKGGVATYISHICKNLPQENVLVVAATQKNLLEESISFHKQQNYEIIREDFSDNWRILFKILRDLLKQKKFNHMHINHILPLGYVALCFKIFKRIPYTIYLHGLDIKLSNTKWHKKFLFSIILRNAYQVITNSENTKSILLKSHPKIKRNIDIVYPCPHEDLQTDLINTDIVSKYKDNLVLLTVARLVKRKGHERILKELPRLIKYYPNLKYVILGDGPYKADLLALINELKLEKFVDFIGKAPQEDLPSYYDLADIFVMPTQEIENDVEGFGITFLEANLFKKVVIGGDNGGVSEAIVHGKSGFLVNNSSRDQLFDTIKTLLDNEDLRVEMGEYAYKRVLENFTWENQIKKIDL